MSMFQGAQINTNGPVNVSPLCQFQVPTDVARWTAWEVETLR